MPISKSTPLQRLDRLDIRVDGRQARVEGDGRVVLGSDRLLAVLHAFSTAKSLQQGLSELAGQAPGRWSWLQLAGETKVLADAGLLRSEDSQPTALRSDPGRFDAADVHLRMLRDRARTDAWREALRLQVRPGDVVLDIGTGTGILAASAVQAGAAHVYAIERSPNMVRLSREFFAANGMGDRVTVIEGSSTEIELPQPADLLVSEVIGNDPLDEQIIPTTVDACRRLLKPDARLVPACIRVLALPLSIPARLREQHFFTPSQLDDWKQAYGLDFTVYRNAGEGQAARTRVDTRSARAWPRFSDALLLADIDLRTQVADAVGSRQRFVASSSGGLDGILVFFEVDLGGGVHFSIHPDLASADNSWASLLWLPGSPLQLQQGAEYELAYSYERRQLSTFELAPVRA